VVEAAPLEGVVDLPGAVAGDDDQRRLFGAHDPDFGNADLEVR
jgi:hypothetical protein